MNHPVSGEVKELSKAQFLELFDPSVRGAIERNAAKPGVDAVVCFEVLQMDSSKFGHRQALIVGPGCTYKVSDIEGAGFRLGDVPSRFAYPVALWFSGKENK